MRSILKNSIGAVLLILFGAVLLICPDFGSRVVASVIGWVILLAGAGYLALTLLTGPRPAEVLAGAAGAVLGLYLVVNPLALASLLGICMGVYLLAQGISVLLDGIRLNRAGADGLASFVWGGILLALGFVLILCPLTTSRLLMTLCGLAMLVCGIVELVLRLRTAQRLDPPDIIDAEQ